MKDDLIEKPSMAAVAVKEKQFFEIDDPSLYTSIAN